MRKSWAERKARTNRKYRRKADAALHKAINPERIDADKEGDDETTRELIKKGLTREKNPRKWGVRNLKGALEQLAKLRTNSVRQRVKRRASEIQEFKHEVTRFEKHSERFTDDEVRSLIYASYSNQVKTFLRDNPSWISRLQAKSEEVRKQKRNAAEKARVKAEEKCKWRSPSLRLPRNLAPD